MTGPACGFVDRVVGAEHLGAAGDHGIACGGVVGAGFLGVGVGAGADEIALADESGDVGGGAIVALEEGGVGLTGFGVGEDDAAAQPGVAFEIDGADMR
jgi:hypothetical protein